MGIFHMFEHLQQHSQLTQLQLYSMPHMIGVEMHSSIEPGLNFLTIGGFNSSVVTNHESIIWTQSHSSQHWEIFVSGV